MRYAVIMAGGSGRRLWPASRRNKPKQLIRLADGKSLLDLAIARLEGLFKPEHILIITSAAYAREIVAAAPMLPRENIVCEPEGRDTANAVALGAELVAARNPQAIMAVFTADQIIRPEDEFRRCVTVALTTAEKNPEALVTLGIRPTWPHTGLGYIHCGPAVGDGARRVLGFKEKPDHHLARHYVESGEYFWNSGMFLWQVATIREALKKFLPESFRRFEAVGQAARSGQDVCAVLAKIYPELARISIDYAVMEKAPHVLMVELSCQWLDVGSWPALEEVVELDGDGNAVVARRAFVVDSSHNVIFSDSDHLLAVVGMDDCIIVHTADATLVCSKSDTQRLRDLVNLIGERFGPEYT